MMAKARGKMDGRAIGIALKEVLCEELVAFYKTLNQDPDKAPHELVVADINFYFMNSDVLDMLGYRATAINNGDWEKVNEINKKLTDLCQAEKPKLQRPLGAFVTFNDERSYNDMEA